MSLPAPNEVRHFVKLADDEKTEAFLPIYTLDARTGRVNAVIGFLWFRERRTYAYSYDPEAGGWEKLAILDRVNPAFMEVQDPFDTSVSVVGEDIEANRRVYYAAKNMLRTRFGVQVMTEFMEEGFLAGEEADEVPELNPFPECPHDGWIQKSMDEAFETPVKSCEECGRALAVKVSGEWVTREQGFDSEWIGEECADVGSHDEYTVFTSEMGASLGRAEVPLVFMGADAAHECPTMTGYDPEIFEGAVFAQGGEVVGYLAWNETFDESSSIALRQAFVREGHRGNRIADEMVRSWWASRPETFLYVGDPNQAGRRVIERLGLYDEQVEGRAVAKDTYVMPSIGVPVQKSLV